MDQYRTPAEKIVQKVKDLFDEYDDLFDGNKIDVNEITNRITISYDDYEYNCDSEDYENNRTELQQAWHDFKQTNETLREHGFKSIYDENSPPELGNMGWEIKLKIDRNLP